MRKKISTAQAKAPADVIVDVMADLVARHRRGEDVMNRAANGADGTGAGSNRLLTVLAIAFFGEGAGSMLHDMDVLSVTANADEHSRLLAVGKGSAAQGVAYLVDLALAWDRRDPQGLREWAFDALAKVRRPRHDVVIEEGGLLAREVWEVPMAYGEPYLVLDRIVSDVVMTRKESGCAVDISQTTDRHACIAPDDIIRAMLLSWDRPAFRALVMGEAKPRAVAA